MNKPTIIIVSFIAMAFLFNPAYADLFVGKFIGEVDGKTYRLEIEQANATGYDGRFMIDDEPMQVDARRFGDRLVGRFANENNSFGFRAEMQGAAPLVHTETGLIIKFRRDYATQ